MAGAYNDQGMLSNQAYFYQLATEMGYTSAAGDLAGLRYPGVDDPLSWPPVKAPKVYDPKLMRDIQAWVDQSAERLLLIYGENDPVRAAAFQLSTLAQARDNHLMVVPKGNHALYYLSDLTEADGVKALGLLEKWLGSKDSKQVH